MEENYAETIAVMIPHNAFDDALSALHVRGTLLLNESYQAPWAIQIPSGEDLVKALSLPPKTRIVPFHFVKRGSFSLIIEGRNTQNVHAGEAVICVGGKSHVMVNGAQAKPVSFLEILALETPLMTHSQPGSTELVCGVFMLRNTLYNPLVDALPDVLHLDVSGRSGGKTIQSLAELLIDEIRFEHAGQNYMCGRLLEMFCAAAIRSYMETAEHHYENWFQGLDDPKIGAALNQIHATPGAMISIGLLARNVGMSSSRFAARFREMTGMPPMGYVTQWRMNIASRLLKETEMNVDQISREVGYENLPAFVRAFRRHYNLPPAKWRKSTAGD
jgi:AraC-like DNA-binding protein